MCPWARAIRWCSSATPLPGEALASSALPGDQAGALLAKSLRTNLAADRKAAREVTRRLAAMPELRQLCSVSGEFDYIALLRTETTQRLDTLLDAIGDLPGVLRTTSSVVLALRVDRAG